MVNKTTNRHQDLCWGLNSASSSKTVGEIEVLLRPIVSEMDRATFLGLGLFFHFLHFLHFFFTLFYFRGTFKALTGCNISNILYQKFRLEGGFDL